MSERRHLVDLIERSYRGQSWHGAALRGAIRGVTPAQAAWRPGPGRHNIHELVLHSAYWKYAVTRRLTGAPRGSFERAGANWFPLTGTDLSSWKLSVRLLARHHNALRQAVAALSAKQLNQRIPGSKLTYWRIVSGVAAHDVYHAGQIQLLKTLQR